MGKQTDAIRRTLGFYDDERPAYADDADVFDALASIDKEHAELVKVLQYYANPYHYDGIGVGDGRYDPVFIREDRGEQARALLSRIGKE